ncbi:methyltransferase domain-containing protein [Tunicatimonas pelagia]|uniref:methyltransferase domain-containing protein n=1 Tax=Tunicatimonas pelagia TaxID=931531 RepID=UPI002664E83D|nr:methyltransferase domain-containing protein [Tunicatimonas pelagia]WKN41999.1 methyltransferase domain-containing protein [Tunicatimonas pelagia]
METLNENYWTKRYMLGNTGWDAGSITTPLKTYIDQLHDKNMKILIPGSGNSYEAGYLFEGGFSQVFIVDLSERPLAIFKEQYPTFPAEQILHQDFFTLNDTFDLIIEQTFFCALNPSLRPAYAQKMHELLKPEGRLVGLLFNIPLYQDHPPFGGSQEEYRRYFEPYFHFHTFELAYNSIAPRQGNELFINLKKKET